MAEGGFATIYAGVQIPIERPVAIKLLTRGILDPRGQERFLQEARTATQITHPNIVTVYDYGFMSNGDRPYIVLEMLEGKTLDETVATGGPMDPTEAVALFIPCLEALAAGHTRGIIHKDLKPENLFLAQTDAGQVLKILDFGIAHVETPQGERMTQEGFMSGTPQYTAPEYFIRQEVSPATDVYQMGLILVESLLGKPLIVIDNVLECMQLHCKGQLGIPTYLFEGELGAVLQKSLAIEPTDRYADAQAFLEDLVQTPEAQQILANSDGSGQTSTAALRAVATHTHVPPPEPAVSTVPHTTMRVRAESARAKFESLEQQHGRLPVWGVVGGALLLPVLLLFGSCGVVLAIFDKGASSTDPPAIEQNTTAPEPTTTPPTPSVEHVDNSNDDPKDKPNGASQEKPAKSVCWVPENPKKLSGPKRFAHVWARLSCPTRAYMPWDEYMAHVAEIFAAFAYTNKRFLQSYKRFSEREDVEVLYKRVRRLCCKAIPNEPPPFVNNESTAMRNVPAATVMVGSAEESAEKDEQPVHEVALAAFAIDTYEVTQQEYATCVKAGVCRASRSQQNPLRNDPYQPVTGVSWYDARTYCEWKSKRLPTEAEWEYAARGLDARPYPWGWKETSCTAVNYGHTWNTQTDNPCARQNPGTPTRVADQKEDTSPFGVVGMAGNAREWVQDWYDPAYYTYSEPENPQGPAKPLTRIPGHRSPHGFKVLRGGGFDSETNELRTTYRSFEAPNQAEDNTFRCAKTP